MDVHAFYISAVIIYGFLQIYRKLLKVINIERKTGIPYYL